MQHLTLCVLALMSLVMATPGQALECANSGTATVTAPDDTGHVSAVACGNSAMTAGLGSIAMGTFASSDGENSTALGRNASTVGDYSTALGFLASTVGDGSTALGHKAYSVGSFSTALGDDATSGGDSSTALGYLASSAGESSTALGFQATSFGASSIALGHLATSTANFSTTVGYQASSVGESSTALGHNAYSAGSFSTALGYAASSQGLSSMAFGRSASSLGMQSAALGFSASSTGTESTALGRSAFSAGERSTALGFRVIADQPDTVIIGSIAGANGASAYANVGMGTSAPSEAVDVQRSAAAARFQLTSYTVTANEAPQFIQRRARGTSAAPAAVQNGDNLGLFSFRGYNGATMGGSRATITAQAAGTFTGASNPTRLIFSTTPVGSTTPQSVLVITPDGKVQVKGVNLDVPDYVFEDDYELMPLEELRSFIDENGHLPGIASADEVQAEGLDLAGSQMNQLQKIEELTLYALQQEGRLAEQESRLAAQQEHLEAQQARIAELEALQQRVAQLESLLTRPLATID